MTIGLTEHAAHVAELDAIDTNVRAVAALLPFEVDLTADMGGTFVLQIDLSTHGGPSDAFDRAGIDPDDGEGDDHWWIETGDGEIVEVSGFTIASDPARVAAWLTDRARALGCPAARAEARA